MLTICAHTLYSLSALSVFDVVFMYRPQGQSFQQLINKCCASWCTERPGSESNSSMRRFLEYISTKSSNTSFGFFVGRELCMCRDLVFQVTVFRP